MWRGRQPAWPGTLLLRWESNVARDAKARREVQRSPAPSPATQPCFLSCPGELGLSVPLTPHPNRNTHCHHQKARLKDSFTEELTAGPGNTKSFSRVSAAAPSSSSEPQTLRTIHPCAPNHLPAPVQPDHPSLRPNPPPRTCAAGTGSPPHPGSPSECLHSGWHRKHPSEMGAPIRSKIRTPLLRPTPMWCCLPFEAGAFAPQFVML